MLRAVNGDPLSDYINGNFIDVSVLIGEMGITGEGLGDVQGHWSGGEGCDSDM